MVTACEAALEMSQGLLRELRVSLGGWGWQRLGIDTVSNGFPTLRLPFLRRTVGWGKRHQRGGPLGSFCRTGEPGLSAV